MHPDNLDLLTNSDDFNDSFLEVRLDPIFIIGYKRSGTTLLRLMLNTCSDVFIPRESEYFQILPRAYNTHIHKVEEIDQLLKTLPKDTFEDLLDKRYLRNLLVSNFPAANNVLLACIYQSCTATVSRLGSRWGDKKPQHWQFVYQLKQWYPQSQFLHVVRDPRDVIASILENERKGVFLTQKNSLWKFFAPHVLYAWQQNFAYREMQKQGKTLNKGRYLRIRYENLVEQPLSNLESICKFLGLDKNAAPKMLDFHQISQDRHMRDGALTQALNMIETTKILNPKNIGKYLNKLSLNQIRDINFICKSIMQDGNYDSSEKPAFPRQLYLGIVLFSLSFFWRILRLKRRLAGGL